MIISENRRLFIDMLETKIQSNDYKLMFVTLYDSFIFIVIKYKEKYSKMTIYDEDITNYNVDKIIEKIKKELPKNETK